MIEARSVKLEVYYQNHLLDGKIGADVESMTYVDSAQDSCDSIDITINAQDGKWLGQWMPEKGATLRPCICGAHWEHEGDHHTMKCGLFTLDDISFSDAPTTLQMGGVSKPGDSGFSETERKTTWKNTNIRKIGETIAARYAMEFSFDAVDYGIESDEQNDTDSSYYHQLCKTYGLVLKVYAKRMWVYDRERYKEKQSVRTFKRQQIRPGSFQYATSLAGTYTGGHFEYTDPDTDEDIVCSIGGGNRILNVNKRATSVYDASVKLCAELNNANHGTVQVRFGVDGEWSVSAGNCIDLAGYGLLDGKYFVDKVTHKVSGSGFTTDFECSGVGKAFGSQEIGKKEEKTEEAAGEAGAAITLDKAPLYVSSTAATKAGTKSGTYYLYDGILINGRYRVTNMASRCGKLPVGQNVTGWVPAEYCIKQE